MQEAVFPQSSVPTQVRVIIYACGQDPLAVTSEWVNDTTGSQLSVPVGVPVFAGDESAIQSMVISGGQVAIGETESISQMVCVHVAELPHASVAVHVRTILYDCVQGPAMVLSEEVMTGEGSQLSVAVAKPLSAGNVLAVHWIVTFAGQVI